MAHILHLIAPALLVLLSRELLVEATDRQILVFGGNGFLGSETMDLLIQAGDELTMVNRGNWYWDSHKRVLPHVQHIKCDRKHPLETCPELVSKVSETEKFDAVIDFSGYGSIETKESSKLLRGKVDLYVMISTDSVYDVCDKDHDGLTKETDSVRPASADEIDRRRHYHTYGHSKLEAEEELLRQRVDDGFPFVILRLPDVVGPRDTTYRFWMYQLWLQLAVAIPERPVTVPHFLQNYDMSLVYSKDVATVILQILKMGPQIRDQIVNLAYPETVPLEKMLGDMKDALGMTEDVIKLQEINDVRLPLFFNPITQKHIFMDLIKRSLKDNSHDKAETNHLYFYPSVRMGPMDVTKAESLFNWKPTPWDDMIRDTVEFYETVMRDDNFTLQRDEIVQIVGTQLYGKDVDPMYEALEKIYDIDLKHFKIVKDEL